MTNPTEQSVVLTHPDMSSVTVRRIPFADAGGVALNLDVYQPPTGSSGANGAVLIVGGYPDPGFRRVMGCAFREMGSCVSWARLLACHGMLAITYDNVDPLPDAQGVLEYLSTNADSLDLDPARVGLWSCSGNAATALALLCGPSVALRCAALLYGYLMDLPGHSEVADTARQFGFTAAMTGRTVADLAAVPTLLVRAGKDAMPGLNDSGDRFVGAALQHNLPITVTNYPEGDHAFDLSDSSATSMSCVRQVVSYLRDHLAAC